MLLQILYYIPIVIALVVVALFAFYRKRSPGALMFGILTLVIAFWILTQFLTQIELFHLSLFYSQTAGLLANFIALYFLFFILSFIRKGRQTSSLKSRSTTLAAFVLPVVFSLLSYSGLLIKRIDVTDTGFAVGEAGWLYNLQILSMSMYILIGVVLIIRDTAKSRENRRRNTILLWAFLQAAIVTILVNTALSSVAASQALIPITIFIMVVMLGYVIFKHKLFDVRLIIARAVAYLLILVTIAGGYSLLVFVLLAGLLQVEHISSVQRTTYSVLALLFGFSLPPLKKFFDKLTNRLFYRDAYDPQELLDRLNKVLVGNIDLDSILKQTADIVATTVKAEYVAFIIRETTGTSRRASFSKLVQLDSEEILSITGKKKHKTELFVADEIEGEQDKIKTILTANNVAIAAKLAGAAEAEHDQGYMLMGAKQSGNPYNKQDVQVLDIIANELVIAIQNALRFEEIETFNITLQQKVTDATRQLRQTNEKLKALDETKDEFISMASHQLRTPLTAVKGYVSMVVEGDAGKLTKQQKELLDQAFASSQRMVYLIADLLNVSRLKSGKFVIENKPTQLADVVESEMEQLTTVAQGKEQTLTYTKPEKFPVLNLDETKIRQVIMNFADNALHYTPNGGHIQIKLEDTGDSVEYTVVDDGLGVPKNEQHHLFTKFYRAGNAKKARPDGTGLGLFMAKKVIIAQGGSIIFKSEENKGSTFGFSFPKAHLQTTKAPAAEDAADKPAPKALKEPAAEAKDKK